MKKSTRGRKAKEAAEALGAESSLVVVPALPGSSAGGDVGKSTPADASKMPPPPVITRHAACQLISFV